jgi:hypothetical protein
MTRVSIFAVMLGLAAAGGCDKAKPTPSDPTQFTFTAQLLPSNEVPLVVNSEASGSGTATITLNVTRDSTSAITGGTANFVVNLTGFPATTSFTMAHIHEAVAGVAGPIKVNTGLASGEVTLTNGAGSFTKNNINVTAADANGMVNTPANFYFNVHTVANGPGVARGQLVKQ